MYSTVVAILCLRVHFCSPAYTEAVGTDTWKHSGFCFCCLNKIQSNITMDICVYCDCGKSSFKVYDFCSFFAAAWIILFGTYNFFLEEKLEEKILLFWGKHSTNIWLTHMQFYMIFAPILVMLLLAGSYAVDWIYNPVTRRKMK